MLTSYVQGLQLNVDTFGTCTYKLQTGYIIITPVTKLSPKIPPHSHPIIWPLAAAVVLTIDIGDYNDHKRTQHDK